MTLKIGIRHSESLWMHIRWISETFDDTCYPVFPCGVERTTALVKLTCLLGTHHICHYGMISSHLYLLTRLVSPACLGFLGLENVTSFCPPFT